MKKLLSLIAIGLLAGCASTSYVPPSIELATVGPIVQGKISGSSVNSVIPFSNTAGSPVIATEAYALPRTGATITATVNLNGLLASNKLWLTNYNSGTGHTNAPTTLGIESQYLVIGGHEYGLNSYRTVGFGYDTAGAIAPVSVGIQEKTTTGNTYGDFVVNTRNSTSSEAPVTIMRVTHDGKILAENPAYTPADANGLVNKKYVDDRAAAAPTSAVRGGVLQVAAPTITITDPIDQPSVVAAFAALVASLKAAGVIAP